MANRRQDRVIPAGYNKYTGEYDKIYYDIITIHGNKYEHCYPNAGIFHTGIGKFVDGNNVFAFKKSERQFDYDN